MFCKPRMHLVKITLFNRALDAQAPITLFCRSVYANDPIIPVADVPITFFSRSYHAQYFSKAHPSSRGLHDVEAFKCFAVT